MTVAGGRFLKKINGPFTLNINIFQILLTRKKAKKDLKNYCCLNSTNHTNTEEHTNTEKIDIKRITKQLLEYL